MREINITGPLLTVELWPNRRLYVNDLLVNLPKGAMSVTWGNERARLTFGSATRTTVTILATPDQARILFDAIVAMERPKEGAVTIS